MWNITEADASSSYVVIDANTGRLLEGSDPNAALPIASLTKVWTAITVLDNVSLDEEITISNAAASQEGSSLYLKAGEVWTVESLLYGLLLHSGNDAAYALAEYTGGSIEGFTKLMNEKIELAGLKNSHFTNPSGLHHEDHFASAIDLANMFRLAMQNEAFAKIASAKSYSPKERSVTWKNKHKLLHYNESAIAGKTGYTKAAGRTLVTFFEEDGKKVIVVTLNQSNDWNTHSSLAANIFKTYDNVKVVEKGKYRLLDKQVIEVKKDYFLLLNKEERDATKNILIIPRKSSAKKPYFWNVTINNEVALKFNVKKID
ncbi:D-alanyl-D-alanine carboxypeptidase family protein [Psychrobacillus sp. OK028]|uniref:D-alanyl-D-alanine carboxypeptidase family protein n=1 Tax=Psychrobacillus sp. OK028 TaxID=1884359 RepID=UPI0015878718|nr:D-alanyl-D-alanine carboxypeptidase family protein [Psychrobacillus sp. OK028]